jgi:hypothetical protein
MTWFYGSALGRIGITPMTVALTDTSILFVDTQLSFLIAAQLATEIDRFLLCVKMPRRAVTPATFYIPSTIRAWYYMMGVRSTFCYHILILYQIYKIKSIATLNFMYAVKCALSSARYTVTLNRDYRLMEITVCRRL